MLRQNQVQLAPFDVAKGDIVTESGVAYAG
jgi:hypothetical protein